jgi:hypothetical protein
VEQQSGESPGVEPQQQLALQSQQQHRVSLCPGGGAGDGAMSPAARATAIPVAAGARPPRPGLAPGRDPVVTEHQPAPALGRFLPATAGVSLIGRATTARVAQAVRQPRDSQLGVAH